MSKREKVPVIYHIDKYALPDVEVFEMTAREAVEYWQRGADRNEVQ
jgi:hypothetical protein